MDAKTCKNCNYHKAHFLGVHYDDEGKEIPDFDHECTLKKTAIWVMDFGCGLWRERE